jgi:hypothetical protein
VQALAEVHETPPSSRTFEVPAPKSAATGFGVRSISQLDPLNHSASVMPRREPTAAHAFGETHDTATSLAPVTDRRNDHLELFQLSTTDPPTATQKLTDEHDTPSRPGPLVGRGCIAQVEPFQRSAKPACDP